MYRSRLLLGIAAVFAGITVSLSILGFVYNLFLLVFAVPFALTTAILWYHATGRLAKRVRERELWEEQRHGFGPDPRAAGSRARERARQQARGPGGPGPGNARDRARQRAGRRAPVGEPSGPSVPEAYRILDLDPGADDETIREAYREKVKRVHPDSTDGSEEAFKRVSKAYERLNDDH
ncbi:J domain-containing protein [Halomicrococcus gelatinilyticus]|uniref:J domain-containing protein n=1 Tax=Halomicrococcus gelatinilyticus TaxID=1702103 RepID=UPI002E0F8981